MESSLRAVNLWGVRHKPVGKFSGGMKRRLSVAISFMGKPAVVFLDEPSTGMHLKGLQHLADTSSFLSDIILLPGVIHIRVLASNLKYGTRAWHISNVMCYTRQSSTCDSASLFERVRAHRHRTIS